MHIRIIVCFLSLYFWLLCHVCFAEEVHTRDKRTDESNGFGQMMIDFLSNIFSSNENTTTDTPVNESLNETTQQFAVSTPLNDHEPQENVTSTYRLQQQEEVTSQGNETTLNQNAISSNISVNPTVTSATEGPAPTEEKICDREPLLSSFCQVPQYMYNMSIWDLYSAIFSDRIISVLLEACSRGTWCLQNVYWESLIEERVSKVTGPYTTLTTICNTEYEPCLSYIVNKYRGCSKYTDFMVTFEATKLVCGLKLNSSLTTTCYKQVITALHVTLADQLRSDTIQETSLDNCESAEVNMLKGLFCVEDACQGESEKFHSFTLWTWFMSFEDDLKIRCNLNSNTCEALLQINTPADVNRTGTNIQTQQTQQQEVSSQAIIQQTTVPSTSATTSYFSSSTTWMFSSTADSLQEDEICYTDAVFQNFCSVPEDMTDVSFWDLYSVFFSGTVLDALMMSCSKGEWCLQDRFDYWEALIVERVDMVMESEIAASMCQPQVKPCILTLANSFKNCSSYSEMVFTSEVLNLICGLKKNPDLTSSCYKHVITAVHVTLADIMRSRNSGEEEADGTCQSPEAEMTKGLICVENSCPGEAETFHSFQPWAWFTSVVNDLIDSCNFDTDVCIALLRRPEGYEMGTLVGISMAVMITALTLTVVVCTCYKRHQRNTVVKEGYQRLLTDGDES